MGSGVKDFIIGGVTLAAGFLLAPTPLNFLSTPLIAYGSGRIIGGITKSIVGEPSSAEGLRANVLGTQASLPVVYGTARVGLRINDTRIISSADALTPTADPNAIISGSDNDDLLFRSGALCLGGENGDGVESIGAVRFNGVEQNVIATCGTANFVNTTVLSTYINHLRHLCRLGTDAQTVPTDLQTHLGWGTNMAGRGIAYLALVMKYDRDIYQGIPSVTAEVQGVKVFDPRTDTWVYPAAGREGANTALVILDYLTSKRYGAGIPYAARDGGTLDFIDEQSFIDAANYCEQQVSIPGAAVADRFAFNGAVDTGRRVSANLAAMLATCRGELIFEGGKFRLSIRQSATAETYQLDEDEIITLDWVRKGAEVPNSIEASYADEDFDYAERTVIWPLVGDTTFLTEDNGVENRVEVGLPYTTNRYQALRTIMVLLREARQDIYATIVAKQGAFALRVGEVVEVTHEGPGWVQKQFAVREIAATPDGRVRLGLQEYASSVYSLDSLSAAATPVSTNLPDATQVNPVTLLTAASDETTLIAVDGGVLVPRVKLSWTAPVPATYVDHYEVEVKETAEAATEWRQATPTPTINNTFAYTEPLDEGTQYDFRVRAVSTVGAKSTWETVSATTADIGTAISTFPVTEAKGGTGEITYAQGDLLVGDGASGLSKLALGTNNYVLKSNGTTAFWSDTTISANDVGTGTFAGDYTFTADVKIDNPDSGLYLKHIVVGADPPIGYTGLWSTGDNLRFVSNPNPVGTTRTVLHDGSVAADFPNWPISQIIPGTFGGGFTWNGATIAALYGGTGISGSSVLQGDILWADADGQWARLIHPQDSGYYLRTTGGAGTEGLQWSNGIVAEDVGSGAFQGNYTFNADVKFDNIDGLWLSQLGADPSAITAGYTALWARSNDDLKYQRSGQSVRTIFHDGTPAGSYPNWPLSQITPGTFNGSWTWNGAVIDELYGGTGISGSSVLRGDIMYSNTDGNWTRLIHPGSSGYYLRTTGGAGTEGLQWSNGINASDVGSGTFSGNFAFSADVKFNNPDGLWLDNLGADPSAIDVGYMAVWSRGGDTLKFQSQGGSVRTVLHDGYAGNISGAWTFLSNLTVSRAAAPADLTVQSGDDRAFLLLDSDTGNNTGEPGGSYVHFRQDGAAIEAMIGTTQTANQWPDGTALTGPEGNSMVIGTKDAYPMVFAQNNSRAFVIDDALVQSYRNMLISGTLEVTGDIDFLTSDERLKNVGGRVQDALAKVRRLTGYHFEYNDLGRVLGLPEGPRLGLLAQDVAAVEPAAVYDASHGYLGMRDEMLTPLLVEAVKALAEQVEVLQARV